MSTATEVALELLDGVTFAAVGVHVLEPVAAAPEAAPKLEAEATPSPSKPGGALSARLTLSLSLTLTLTLALTLPPPLTLPLTLTLKLTGAQARGAPVRLQSGGGLARLLPQRGG